MIVNADCLAALPLASGSVQMCVTSPPYWGLRDYGVSGQIGLEPTPAEFVAHMVEVFREVWRVLRDDGTLWLNLGDSYSANAGQRKATDAAGIKQQSNVASINAPSRCVDGLGAKQLIGIPWRVALALQADGWYLRSDIIWSKPNPMPESVTDRPTKAHEYLFLLSKQARYYYDAEAIREPVTGNTHARISQDLAEQVGSYRANGGNKTNGPMKAVLRGSTRKLAEAGSGIKSNRSMEAALSLQVENRNRRTVWEIPTAPYSGAHFATFPPALVEPCILAGTSAVGNCAECGAPWERVTEHVEGTVNPRGAEQRIMASGGALTGGTQKCTIGNAGHVGRNNTTGWRATCAHTDAPTVPAIVLDPFAGSGTTGAVARLHGRRFVGLDLNATYLRELALPRAEGRQTAQSMMELPLFAGV